MVVRQWIGARRRAHLIPQGISAPPFLIFSVTAKCNFHCAGCYSNALHRLPRAELTTREVEDIVRQARDLGTMAVLLAGGEPLLREELLFLTAKFPTLLFLLFTNGSLLDPQKIGELKKQPHVVPIISLEGEERETDHRRGAGTYLSVTEAMARLQQEHIPFGTSITLTRHNFEEVTKKQFLVSLLKRGCYVYFYINYVPVVAGTENLELLPEQVREFGRTLADLRASLPAIFVAFPYDEVAAGGCLAAGRGFVHINAYGDLEPCPFSPYTDANLREQSYAQALGSPLLQRIRESGVVLDESDGRCALWKKRDWVASLEQGLCRESSRTES
ncbi:MAG: radical SAM protein [Candidatus Bipolaricaulota bacterium]|nr:radical SAM protein [Candidatus Bipolaricaulota bacterium]